MKEEQKLALFSGRDVFFFVWLPTGFRKRICVQMLPFMFNRRHTQLGSISIKFKPDRQYSVTPEAVNFSIGSGSTYSGCSHDKVM